LQERGEKE
jgi:hypothetical protein